MITKFEIGDIVIGNAEARCYGVTCPGWTGEVVRVYSNGDIEVRDKDNHQYQVDPNKFDLFDSSNRIIFVPEMKICLRNNYQWIDAAYSTKLGAIIDKNFDKYKPIDILMIDNDVRKKYVGCRNCGEVFLNTPEAIAEHINRGKSSDYCITCNKKSFKKLSSNIVDYVKNDDGSYNIKKEDHCMLYCGSGSRAYDVHSEEARRRCMFANCTNETILPLSDTHINNPMAFDKLATTDALLDCKWDFVKAENGYFVFKAKKRFTLKAYVNQYGVIDFFKYSYRDSEWSFMYSHRYNMLFWDYPYMNDWKVNNDFIDSDKKEQILATVAELYKGE